MKKRIPGIIVLYLFAFLFSTLVGANETENIYKKLSVQQCDSLIKANETNPNFVILDVRTPSAWSTEHLEGSINRNFYDSDFNQKLDALPKHKTFLIHCQSGSRSGSTFVKMQNLEFTEVYDMSGGISSWKNASLPTTNVIQPKLMLVSYEETESNSNSDTIKVTVTNRANHILTFNSLELFDIHEVNSDFNPEYQLKGAEDYTFSVFHIPGYTGSDSTFIQMESNGGNLEISILLENGIILDSPEQILSELKVFPNPASNYLELKSSEIMEFDFVSIIDINGQTVLVHKNVAANNRINIHQLESGIYFLRIQKGGNYQVEKIMINH